MPTTIKYGIVMVDPTKSKDFFDLLHTATLSDVYTVSVANCDIAIETPNLPVVVTGKEDNGKPYAQPTTIKELREKITVAKEYQAEDAINRAKHTFTFKTPATGELPKKGKKSKVDDMSYLLAQQPELPAEPTK